MCGTNRKNKLTCPACMYSSCASNRSCRVVIQGRGSRRSQACAGSGTSACMHLRPQFSGR